MNGVRVLIVDDYEAARWGLKKLLEKNTSISSCETASNGQTALEVLGNKPIDVVLMDVEMPAMDGVEATNLIISKYENAKIIGLTAYHRPERMWEMIGAGVKGYVQKKVSNQTIVDAIVQVHEGGVFFCEESLKDLIQLIAEGRQSLSEPLLEKLTRQERKILPLVGQDLSNKEIAEKLFISPRTVESHKRNLARKAGISDTRQLHEFAISALKKLGLK